MDLSAVASFQLGQFHIVPARCELSCSGAVTRLEPKVMAVLVTLAQHPGVTISREKLLDAVWGGRAVTDDAVTRCISALRRAFGEGKGVEIRSLPKIGYLLSANPVEPAAAPVGRSAAAAPRAPMRTLIAVAAALGIVAVAVLSFRAPPPPDPGGRVRPLTSLPGLELYPALAPAGGQLAFAHRDGTGQWDLYVSSLAGGEPHRLTNDPLREQHPVWSRSGAELAYVRSDGSRCELVRMAVPGGTARKLADCGARLVHSVDWSADGRLFAMTRSDERLQPARLALLAVDGVAPVIELDPALGVEDARFAPSGERLGFSLATAIGAEDVYVATLASGEVTRLTSDHAKVHGLDWTDDGRAIIYGSNRGGNFGLHRVSLTGAPPQSLLPSLSDLENPSVAGPRIAYEAWTESGELRVQGPQTVHLPPDSTRLEWHPDVAQDGAITFVSDRSGAPEVWLFEAGSTRQLTHFGNAYVHTPKFAPDGRTIAFSAPQRGFFNLYLLSRDGTERRLTDHESNDLSPAWSADGRTLFHASDRDGAWSVWRLDVASGETRRVSRTPARAVYVLNPGTLVIVDPVNGGLHRLDLQHPDRAPTLLAAATAPSDWPNIVVAGGQVIYVRREPPDRAVLRRVDPVTGTDEALAELADFYFRSGLAITPTGALLHATTRVEDVSLMLLETPLTTGF